MKYCSFCGSSLEAGVSYCPNCGAKVSGAEERTGGTEAESIESVFTGAGEGAPEKTDMGIAIISCIFPLVGGIMYLCWQESNPQKARSAVKGLLAWLCYNFPIVGLILYFVWKDEKPQDAKIAGIAAIVGAVLSVVSYVLQIVLAPIFGMSYFATIVELLNGLLSFDILLPILTI